MSLNLTPRCLVKCDPAAVRRLACVLREQGQLYVDPAAPRAELYQLVAEGMLITWFPKGRNPCVRTLPSGCSEYSSL